LALESLERRPFSFDVALRRRGSTCAVPGSGIGRPGTTRLIVVRKLSGMRDVGHERRRYWRRTNLPCPPREGNRTGYRSRLRYNYALGEGQVIGRGGDEYFKREEGDQQP